MENTEFAKPKTSHKKLYSYQKGKAIYDLTRAFLETHLSPKDRTYDQMLQAARSGKSNIVEGRKDAAISLESEIKLYGIAIGSLEELKEDYDDYMRTHHIPKWDNTHPRFSKLREVCAKNNSTQYYMQLLPKLNDEEFLNMMITLINQNISMLNKLLEHVKQDFLKFGGIKEQMFKARTQYRIQHEKKLN